jgi:hypothetical protein
MEEMPMRSPILHVASDNPDVPPKAAAPQVPQARRIVYADDDQGSEGVAYEETESGAMEAVSSAAGGYVLKNN